MMFPLFRPKDDSLSFCLHHADGCANLVYHPGFRLTSPRAIDIQPFQGNLLQNFYVAYVPIVVQNHRILRLIT